MKIIHISIAFFLRFLITRRNINITRLIIYTKDSIRQSIWIIASKNHFSTISWQFPSIDSRNCKICFYRWNDGVGALIVPLRSIKIAVFLIHEIGKPCMNISCIMHTNRAFNHIVIEIIRSPYTSQHTHWSRDYCIRTRTDSNLPTYQNRATYTMASIIHRPPTSGRSKPTRLIRNVYISIFKLNSSLTVNLELHQVFPFGLVFR